MKHSHRLVMHLVALAIAIFISVAAVPGIHASSSATAPNTHASSSSTVPQLKNCAVESVHLHGNNPPEAVCLRQIGAAKTVSPLTRGTDCSGNTLQLEGSDGTYDLILCFIGTGFINMTDYVWIFYWNSWNDKAYYYIAGCNTGVFYSDTNGNGTRQSFFSGQSGFFNGSPLYAHTLSSFSINSSC